MKLVLLLLFAIPITAFAGTFSDQEVYSLPKSQKVAQIALQDSIVFESEKHYILKTPQMDIENKDYFFVGLHPTLSDPGWLMNYGEVHDFRDGDFAVITPNSEDDLLEVIETLHHASGNCGVVQRITGDPLIEVTANPTPIYTTRNANISDLVKKIDFKNVVRLVEELVSWGTRYHNHPKGKQAGELIAKLYEQYIPADRDDVSILLVSHPRTSQRSFVVRIEGTQRPKELVLLGSHIDSINRNNNSYAPGADDDASGTATNLEIFRVLMENNIRPLRTIEFQGYAAEEIGLVGSGDLASKYKSQGRNVISMVQFDMNGYSRTGQDKIFFVSNGTNPRLTDELGKLVDQYVGLPWQKKRLWMGSSDHASWHRQGYPVAMPSEDPQAFNRAIHTDRDTMKGLNQKSQMGYFAQLGLAYLLTYAGM